MPKAIDHRCENPECRAPIVYMPMRYEKRIEFISADHRERLGVVMVARLCKACAKMDLDTIRRTGKDGSIQGGLFSEGTLDG